MNHGGSGTDCKVSFESDDEEARVDHRLLVNGQSKISLKPNPTNISTTSVVEIPVYHPLSESQPRPASLVASSSREGDDETMSGLHGESENLKEMELPSPSKETSRRSKISSKKPSLANLLPKLPRQLTRQEIEAAIRCGPKRNFTNNAKYQNISLYDGYLLACQSRVLIKVFRGDCSHGILEAEKTSAVSMQHKHIQELIGYHKSCEDCAVLVYPFAECWGNLDEYLTGSGETQLELRFGDKLSMAIKIAEGIRYMHEECPGGPVVHGDLQPINILLTFNFRPLVKIIPNQKKWLHLGQGFENRCRLKDFLDHETMSLVKSDVQAFGVLLLRLFCRISAPKMMKARFSGLARPLLLEGAFPEFLDDDSKDYDPYGVYTVFCAAAKCTTSRPDSRPCMSEVISILKQERFCNMQLSSPNYHTMRSLTLAEFTGEP
ncbi:hypothetical protein I3842_07G114100 [Carya illinoinensis]|uniref:Protein kinase domain-containing protein n=1 Tax=Carya illinoinensis TaxID=32201 RepID=A0A922EJD2_CARIL|nr:hypothetical protein I3842_07G114100 [Carya illinoinensis]